MSTPIPPTCSFYDVPCNASWVVIQLEIFGIWLWQTVLNGATSLFEMIPIPDFLLNIQPVTIPSSVGFFLGPFAIEYGIGIIVSAYIARFLVRRIPVVG
jgi:hypothetical protein